MNVWRQKALAFANWTGARSLMITTGVAGFSALAIATPALAGRSEAVSADLPTFA
jgi:hypothetical protein